MTFRHCTPTVTVYCPRSFITYTYKCNLRHFWYTFPLLLATTLTWNRNEVLILKRQFHHVMYGVVYLINPAHALCHGNSAPANKQKTEFYATNGQLHSLDNITVKNKLILINKSYPEHLAPLLFLSHVIYDSSSADIHHELFVNRER